MEENCGALYELVLSYWAHWLYSYLELSIAYAS